MVRQHDVAQIELDRSLRRNEPDLKSPAFGARQDVDLPLPEAHRDVNAKVREGKVQGVEGIATMHKIHFPHLFCREFLDRVRDPRLTDPVADILGADVLGINTLFIFKAPRPGIGFPWHQDKYYFSKNFVTDTTVGTWQAIDEATVDNGCLWVIPGSHRRRIAEHDRQTGAQQSEFLLARNTDDRQGIAVEMKPGSVLWFHSHLLHKSIDNHSTAFRRCYVAHYLSARARYVTPGKVGQPVMWVRGQTYPDCVQADTRDVLPVA